MANDKHNPPTPTEAPTPPTNNDREFIRDLVTGLVEGMQRRNPSDLDLTGMSAERQRQLVSKQDGTRYRHVPGVGPSGAVFDFVVQDLPGFLHGKVIGLANYKHPDGMLKWQSNGGVVPDGMQIAIDKSADLQIALADKIDVDVTKNELFSLQYVMWKLQTFWYADTKALVGKSLQAHFCRPPEGEPVAGAAWGVKTPWDSAIIADAAE